MNKRVFGTPAWAGFLKDWDGPEPGEQPTGYVVVLVDTAINPNADQDVGIACQTMLLGAAERGLGVPVEHVILEEADSDASVKYYREPDGTHHVPKRRLADLILKSFK